MALAILELVKPIAPTIFHLAGPPCITTACPEGARSCGKIKEVRRLFLREKSRQPATLSKDSALT